MSSFEPTSDSTTHGSDGADWLALRFVLGELPADDAADFEAKLAGDQKLRDSLVRATRLVETIAAAPLPLRPAAGSPRRRLRRVVALLAAMAAIVIVGVVAFRSVPDAVEPQFAADDADPARLVMLWTASAGTLNGNFSGSGTTDGELTDELGGDPQSGLLPPDWMLAAVEYESRISPDIDPAGNLDLDDDAIERN